VKIVTIGNCFGGIKQAGNGALAGLDMAFWGVLDAGGGEES
jgi:hypothetical protein